MRKIFLDVNVLLDFILNRRPFFNAIHNIIRLSENGEIEIYASSVTLTTLNFFIKKELGTEKTKQKIEIFLKLIKWTEVNEAILISAHSSNFTDFEDAVQYFSALSVKNIHAIISRNKKDFKYSLLPVYTADEFLAKYFSD